MRRRPAQSEPAPLAKARQWRPSRSASVLATPLRSSVACAVPARKAVRTARLNVDACYLLSIMKVGARPLMVENPEGVSAVIQLEQPCTLPRKECGCTSTRSSRMDTDPY